MLFFQGLTTAGLTLVTAGLLPGATAAEMHSLKYPSTRQVEQVDDYHGTKVADPYRWLEDDNSPETAAWVASQNMVTFGFLENIPQRVKIRGRLRELWNYERLAFRRKKGAAISSPTIPASKTRPS
jgi:prolyl oligopeptidase